jgi:DtxR family transcriptional regulator, Mn-dependent transcriptional regulator
MAKTMVEQPLSRSQEDYLKALYHLARDERPVTTGELAQRLGISAASVSEMVSRLADLQLVRHDRYRGQQLTPDGRRVALELVRHHRLIEMFLVRVLGYGWDEVHDEAERLEHVISERMEERIFEVLGQPDFDPHGHEIPSRDGVVRRRSDERTLDACRRGEDLVVSAVADDDSERLRAIERRGLVPGARLKIEATSEFESPIEVKLDGRAVSVPLGLARGIFVTEARS